MKLSIVILCWNDLKVLSDCLRSIYGQTWKIDLEVIVADNGSNDGTVDFVRREYPTTRVLENKANLGFARGNNVGIEAATGKYILILNPDTIIHEGALDRWIEYSDRHPDAGAFGCRVLWPDGRYQHPARPFPTVWRYWIAALYLRPLGYLSQRFLADRYVGWEGRTEREIDWQSGCCILFRGQILKSLKGFDERFFYHFEEVDLCYRIWQSGHTILFTPDVEITHLEGQSVSCARIRFELEKFRNRYRYFHKHYGPRGARRCRQAALAYLGLRRLGYGLISLVRSTDRIEHLKKRYGVALRWNWKLNLARFVERGEEPDVGYEPLTSARGQAGSQ